MKNYIICVKSKGIGHMKQIPVSENRIFKEFLISVPDQEKIKTLSIGEFIISSFESGITYSCARVADLTY